MFFSGLGSRYVPDHWVATVDERSGTDNRPDVGVLCEFACTEAARSLIHLQEVRVGVGRDIS